MSAKKKECPSCAMMVDKSAKACPICQYEFTQHNIWYQVIAVLLILLFVLFFIF